MNKLFAPIMLIVCLISSCVPDTNLQSPIPVEPTVATMPVTTDTPLPIAGDLGWGKIHGKVTDAVTGSAVVGAKVTCSHHSFTSPKTCSGNVTTDEDGIYIFDQIFFHDTDSVQLIVQTPGYQKQEIMQTFFTMPDMQANVALNYIP